MVYKDLSTDERIKRLLADIAKKMKNIEEKREFLKSLGFSDTKEIVKSGQEEKEKLIDRLIIERAKRLTAANVSFQL